MVRKSSAVAVVLGVFLWLLPFLFRIPALANCPASLLFLVGAAAPHLGIVCMWWPLMRRGYRPAGMPLLWASRAVGVMALLMIVVVAVLFNWISVLGKFAPAFAIQFAFGVCLFRKPRLLLSWGLSMLIGGPLWAIICLAAFPPGILGRSHGFSDHTPFLPWVPVCTSDSSPTRVVVG